jgi:hypothetical protein
VRARLHELPCHDAVLALHAIGEILSASMGGSSGVLAYVRLLSIAFSLRVSHAVVSFFFFFFFFSFFSFSSSSSQGYLLRRRGR